MKIISFNTNSIRMRQHQLASLIERHQPDVIGIQETKAQDIDFPIEMIETLGYHACFHGQKTHYGVALLSKQPAQNVQKGFEKEAEDAQRRFISGEFEIDGQLITIMNGYFPQGESNSHPTKYPAKRDFYANLQTLLEQKHSSDENIIVMGDMNIAPSDKDIGIGADNIKRWLKTGKCSFLPEEREWLQKLYDWGLHDTFRQQFPDVDDKFSWFDYRSKGFDREPKRGLRIDLILSNQALLEKCIDTGIDYPSRSMEKPSDHCPIWAEFKL